MCHSTSELVHSLTTYTTFGACSDAPYSDVNYSIYVSMYICTISYIYSMYDFVHGMAWHAADVAPTPVLEQLSR